MIRVIIFTLAGLLCSLVGWVLISYTYHTGDLFKNIPLLLSKAMIISGGVFFFARAYFVDRALRRGEGEITQTDQAAVVLAMFVILLIFFVPFLIGGFAPIGY